MEARNDILARVRRYDAIMERVYRECNAADERLRRNMALQVLHPSTAHPQQGHTFISHWRGDKASLFNEKMKIWLEDADTMMSSRQRIMRAQDEKFRGLCKRLSVISRDYNDIEEEAYANVSKETNADATKDTMTQINLEEVVSRRNRLVLC